MFSVNFRANYTQSSQHGSLHPPFHPHLHLLPRSFLFPVPLSLGQEAWTCNMFKKQKPVSCKAVSFVNTETGRCFSFPSPPTSLALPLFLRQMAHGLFTLHTKLRLSSTGDHLLTLGFALSVSELRPAGKSADRMHLLALTGVWVLQWKRQLRLLCFQESSALLFELFCCLWVKSVL